MTFSVAEPRPPRRLVLSIHDVSPRHEGAVDRLRDLLVANGGERMAMLVVPNFWGEAPILRGSPFAARLRRWAEAGVEMFLHGSLHRDDSTHGSAVDRFKARRMTAGEGEFLGLDRAEAARRIAAGRSLIEDVTGRPVAGFVAPAWLYGPGALAAMTEARIGLAEDHWKIWDAASGAIVARSPVITWASRTPARMASSLAVAAAARAAARLVPGPRVLRVAVHPGDVTAPPLVRSITATVAALGRGRTVSRYEDLVGDAGCRR